MPKGIRIKNAGIIHVKYHPVFITNPRSFWILALSYKIK